jgi:hypothetical protein
LGGADKASGWGWPARVEAEWRLFSKAVVNELLGLTTAFDSQGTLVLDFSEGLPTLARTIIVKPEKLLCQSGRRILRKFWLKN